MKHSMLMLLALSAALSGGFACSGSDPVAVDHPHLDTYLASRPNDVYVGDWIGAELVLSNRSDENIVVSVQQGCLLEIELVDEFGRTVVRRWDRCGTMRTTLTVHRGFTLILGTPGVSTIRTDTPDAEWFLRGDRVPPGRYRLRIGFSSTTPFRVWAEESITVHES